MRTLFPGVYKNSNHERNDINIILNHAIEQLAGEGTLPRHQNQEEVFPYWPAGNLSLLPRCPGPQNYRLLVWLHWLRKYYHQIQSTSRADCVKNCGAEGGDLGCAGGIARGLEVAVDIQVIKMWVRFRRRPIPKEKQLQYIHPEVSSIQSEKTMVETILKKMDISFTPIEEINKTLQNSQIKFIDSEFPP